MDLSNICNIAHVKTKAKQNICTRLKAIQTGKIVTIRSGIYGVTGWCFGFCGFIRFTTVGFKLEKWIRCTK